eukprot:3989643-Amphidinium_carterae.2
MAVPKLLRKLSKLLTARIRIGTVLDNTEKTKEGASVYRSGGGKPGLSNLLCGHSAVLCTEELDRKRLCEPD